VCSPRIQEEVAESEGASLKMVRRAERDAVMDFADDLVENNEVKALSQGIRLSSKLDHLEPASFGISCFDAACPPRHALAG